MVDALNPEQEAAACHRGSHLLLVAGAGTGKTRTLVERMARLVEEGIPPDRLLAITFTNKAAGELRERLLQRLGRSVPSGTFHGTALRWLKTHGQWRNRSLYDDRDQLQLITGLLKSLPGGATPQAVKSALQQVRLHPHLPRPDWDRAGQIAQEILPRYLDRLERLHAIDFQGLLEEACAVVESGQLDGLYAEVLVDEFQDTDPLQHRILKALAKGGTQIMAVGDDDQAIYGWRGADLMGILRFEQDYPPADVLKLTENYRSTEPILAAANALIARNVERRGKTLVGQNRQGDEIRVFGHGDDRQEAEGVAALAAKLVHTESYAPQNIAILARTNAQLRPIEGALNTRGLGYRLLGGTALFDTKEVRDLMAYLRLWANPASDPDFLRIANRPRRGLGAKALEKIQKASAGSPILPWLQSNVEDLETRAKKAVKRFLDDFGEPPTTALEALDRVLEEMGYLEFLAAEDPERFESRQASIDVLVHDANKELQAFLEQWGLAATGDKARGDGLRLATCHAAKGLEFDAVILPGWEEGMFPMIRDGADPHDQLEEERRLAYVGMTRARHRLMITWAQRRMSRGQWQDTRPSRFLRESGLIDGALPVRAVQRRPPRSMDPDELLDQEGGAYAPGFRVDHETFGEGLVLGVRGMGATASIQVRFDSGEKKTIRASFLKPLGYPD
ncbi:MAG: UvrD-helicase domain-containing protein [Myxococcota bacterium]|jgi:DNA helicase-2/ATP-dependent DNA helicase PcrA|nr:UvrD-helicase domain-containing protein [Myxococcota bacterium]